MVLPIAFSISLPALLAMGSQGCGGARAPLKSLPALDDGGARSIELPKGLEDKRAVYLAHLAIAEEQLIEFSARTNKFEKEPRPIERVRVFTSKSDFDKAINVPATNGTDARFKGSVPSTVVGAIVGDALFVVSEPLYFQTFPGHVERDYEKLLRTSSRIATTKILSMVMPTRWGPSGSLKASRRLQQISTCARRYLPMKPARSIVPPTTNADTKSTAG